MIGESFAKQLNLKIQLLTEPRDNMVSANGSRMEIVGSVDIELYIKGASLLWNTLWW